jgi:hypothetical protein
MKQVLPMFPRPRVPGSSVLVADEEEPRSDPRVKLAKGAAAVRGEEVRWLLIRAKKPSLDGKRGPSGTSVTALSSGGGDSEGGSTSQPVSVSLTSTMKLSSCIKPASSRVLEVPSTISQS